LIENMDLEASDNITPQQLTDLWKANEYDDRKVRPYVEPVFKDIR